MRSASKIAHPHIRNDTPSLRWLLYSWVFWLLFGVGIAWEVIENCRYRKSGDGKSKANLKWSEIVIEPVPTSEYEQGKVEGAHKNNAKNTLECISRKKETTCDTIALFW